MQPDYITRVKKERDELATKIEKLSTFRDTDNFKNLSSEEQYLLITQHSAMHIYLTALADRLALYSEQDKT